MSKINEILIKKTHLLSQGVYLDKNSINSKTNIDNDLDLGRKGGAGPSGGRYFLFEDNKTLVNVALWNTPDRSDLSLKREKEYFFEVFNQTTDTFFCRLKLIQHPKFYSSGIKTSDGIQMKKIALVHGIESLATTIYQKCDYWECGNACKFCGIQISLANNNTILEKSPKQISEVITMAKKEGRCSHLTLTSGTEFGEDKGALRYIKIINLLKKEHPNVPIHIQIEPFIDLTYLDKLKKSGADTIGIHIEVLDDAIRKRITPGKYKIPYQLFIENWRHAIDVFGKNQVDTFILTGLGESPKELINSIQSIVSIGVIPFITPVRSFPGQTDLNPSIKSETLLQIYRNSAEFMKDYGVNPLEHKAGCVKCGGCSAINEAYRAI